MTRLDLSGNPLGALGPQHLVNLTSLRRLDVSNATLREIDPGAFGQLRRLTELDLSYNLLSTTALKDADFLQPVADSLEVLKLHHNDLRLEAIDEALGQLRQLKELTLGGNRAASTIRLGSRFGANLKTLKRLSFAGNRIQQINFDSFQALHYGTKPGQFETSKIHFPTSEGVSEVSERANE